MRTFRLLYFFPLFLFLNCSKNKTKVDSKDSIDSVVGILNMALNNETHYPKRILYTNKARAILVKQSNDSLNSDRLVKVAKNYYYLCLWDNLRTTSNQLHEKSIQKRDLYFEAQAYRWLGVYYENVSINDSAFYYYLKAEKIFKNQNKQKELCEVLNRKSFCLF